MENEPQPPEESTDDILIRLAITDAEMYDEPIGHAVARCIASQHHDGQGSALYAFTSTGSMHGDDIAREVARSYTEAEDQDKPALYQLMRYIAANSDRGCIRPPVEGWADKARWDNGNLERELIRKFAHTSTNALIVRLMRGEAFKTDDEEYELSRRLRLIGRTWQYTRDGSDQIVVVDLGEGDE